MNPISAGTGGSTPPRWRDGTGARLAQWTVLVFGIVGFALPLLAILIDGIGPGIIEVASRPSFWKALGTSLLLGSGSAILTLMLALGIGMGRAASSIPLLRVGIGAPANAYLAVPAVVLSLGAFLLVRNAGMLPEAAAPVVVLLANALLSLPFALATLAPPLDAIAERRGRLIRSLGLSGWRQFVAVEWPLLGREAGVVLALAFCFSLGDLGVIALFGTEDFATLPLLIYRALGAYRSNDAAAIAALMLIITIAAFVLLPKLFGKLTDASS